MLHFDCNIAIKRWVDVKNHRGRVVYLCILKFSEKERERERERYARCVGELTVEETKVCAE